MTNGRYDRGRESRDPRSARSGFDDDRGRRFPGGQDDRDDRGFFERAGDEISSWFGDEDAPRRPDIDDRRFEQGRRSGRSDAAGRDYQPMAGDYGRVGPSYGERFGPERAFHEDRFDRGSSQREGPGQREGRGQREAHDQRQSAGAAPAIHDPHYSDWRRQQIGELDRDYDEYRRENQSRFESDFSNWRTTRQAKRQMLGSIRENMQVIGADDQPVGTVDKVRGDRIILTKEDSPDALHHTIGCGMIDRVEGDRVILAKKADEARASWGSEERDRALFERDDQRSPGPHILDRSFSGTY